MAALLLGSIAVLSVAGGAVVADARWFEQKARDNQRRTYRLTFPPEVKPDKVVSYFNELSGILRPKTSMLAGMIGARDIEQAIQSKPSIVLEMRGTEAGYSWYLQVPYGAEEAVRGRLESLIPGIQLERVPGLPTRPWTKVTELQLHYGHRPLKVDDPADKSVSLRSGFGHVSNNEELAFQIVITPMRSSPKPAEDAPTVEWGFKSYTHGGKASRDELTARREKAEQTNFLTTIRVAAVAKTEPRASLMVRNLTSVFDSTAHGDVYFKPVPLSLPKLCDRMNCATTPARPKVQLTAFELSAFTGWPLGDTTTPGQPSPISRRLHTPSIVLHEGIKLGQSNYGAKERDVYLGFKEALVHQHTIAPPGKGKTVLLANKFKQIVDKGYGAIVIEETGDLIRYALDYIPTERIPDVIYLNAADVHYPVGLNILREGNASAAVDSIVSIFESMYPDHPSMWAQRAMYNGLHTLWCDPNATITDLLALVSPTSDEREWSRRLRGKATDPQIKRYWQEMENDGVQREQEKMGPLNNRFWPMERSALINILGQSQSKFTMEEVVRQNKILLVNLAGIDNDASRIMGAMLVSALWRQVKATPMPHSPNFLIMDEAHHFMNLPVDLGMMLVEARKWGLGIDFAHQALYQLPPAMRQAVQQNMQTKVVFQTLADDARDMARVLGNPITEHDVSHLGQYEAIARIATPSGISSPLTMNTLAPAKGYGNADRVIYASRGRYGTPISQVREELRQRRAPVSTPRRKNQPYTSDGLGGL